MVPGGSQDGAMLPLPAGFCLVADPRTRSLAGGTVLVGGSPARVLRLTPQGASLVARWWTGTPVGSDPAHGHLARRLVSGGLAHPRPPGPTGASGATGLTGATGAGGEQVSVVIPVKDRPGELATVLGALEPVAEVLVVDDGSTAGALLAEAARRAGATYLRLDPSQGPAAARNAGLAAARSPLVAFVDSDCVPSPGWLAPLVAHFADPKLGAAAPRVTLLPPARPGALARYEAARSPLDRGRREGLVRPRSPIPFVPTAALVVRRAAAPQGLFDEALVGGEDVDAVWRLAAAGWDVRYVPTVTVAHPARGPLRSWVARRAFYGATAGPLARRHGAALAPAATSRWTAAFWTLLLTGHPLWAAGVAGNASGLLARRLAPLVENPVGLGVRLAAGGMLAAGPPLATGLARAWSPALAAALLARRTRPLGALGLAVGLAAGTASWVGARRSSGQPGWPPGVRPLDPVRHVALHLLDDLAYGTGVWASCARSRTWRPLVPDLVAGDLWGAPFRPSIGRLEDRR